NIIINLSELKEKLVLSRHRDDLNSNSKVFILIPDPDGGSARFEVMANTTMHPDLQRKFEGIRTFDIVMEDNPSVHGKIDFTHYGFHAMIMSPEQGTYFIDPIFLGNDVDHMVYFKKDFLTDKDMECEFKGDPNYSDLPPSNREFGTCELKTYRLALCATGEYTIFHGGSIANAASAQVTTMNRVNGIYERDMAVTMTIVANNDDVIYTNPATDPFSNGNAGAMLDQCQATCDAEIGNANYDIGHVFGTNSGGVAYLGVVCNNSYKGRGVTGSGAPIGDSFDIDYVAHEMGHQFGCNHSFNNSCGGNRNNATAVEPGSGSTIMAYAGICSPNVQSNSDDHFSGINLQEMGAFTMGSGGTCAVKTTLSNNAPEISGTNGNVYIPANTPFALTAIATDLDDDDLLYCWEQMDNQISVQPPSPTSTGGPNFRSNSPNLSPTRYFPDLEDLANGTVSQWEVLASVTRLFNFRVMVRDNAPGGGCNDHADVTVNTDAGSGPFVVTLPTVSGISWIGTASQTVTWDVANTDQSPVNATSVDIFLSIDGGDTYPTQIADDVANDGSETITVPNTPSATCRIMVMAQNGTFFDISNNNFEITQVSSDYTITTSESSQTACPPEDVTYTIDVGSLEGFNDPVTLSVTGLPTGASGAFNTNPVIPEGSSILTVSGSGSVTPGEYDFTVDASGSTGNKSLSLTYTVVDGSISIVTLNSPANEATDVVTPVNLQWSDAGIGSLYDLEVATDAGFNDIVSNQVGLTENSFYESSLLNETLYYWRVTAYNECSAAPVSSTYSFTTGTCSADMSTDVPINIPSSGSPTVTSTLNITQSGTIQDLNVVNLTGQHTWVSDLTITLTSPQGTMITLFSNVCGDADDWDLNFDDDAAPGALPCPPTDGGTYQPLNPLSNFNGENVQGTWTLSIADALNQDGGSLNSWGIEYCTVICIDADVPELSATELNICPGEETTLSIASGNLNDATEWEWYANSCGGTALGMGASINVNPSVTTTYYAHGVGGCTGGSAPCGSISVNVYETYSTTNDVSICEGESYTFPDGSSSSETTTNTSVFEDGNGCDSTIITNLLVII
ncbi:MAG: propanediol utilization protein, partial [Bacteroidetes bacterium]